MQSAGQDALEALFSDIAPKLGLTRPAGLCFAAIWCADAPPCADELVTALGLSRSNVSTALKELRAWGLVGRARVSGDRRDRFTAAPDPWAVARQLLAERTRRDLAPTLDRLYAIEAETGDARVAGLCEVVEGFSSFLGGLARLDPADLAEHLGGAGGENGKKKKKKKA